VKRKLEEVKLAVGGSGEAGGAVEPAKKSSKPLSAVEQIMLENENKKKREQEEVRKCQFCLLLAALVALF
jgi:hypothetical protein